MIRLSHLFVSEPVVHPWPWPKPTKPVDDSKNPLTTELKEDGIIEICVLKTQGDMILDMSGKGLFTKELDTALLKPRIVQDPLPMVIGHVLTQSNDFESDVAILGRRRVTYPSTTARACAC